MAAGLRGTYGTRLRLQWGSEAKAHTDASRTVPVGSATTSRFGRTGGPEARKSQDLKLEMTVFGELHYEAWRSVGYNGRDNLFQRERIPQCAQRVMGLAIADTPYPNRHEADNGWQPGYPKRKRSDSPDFEGAHILSWSIPPEKRKTFEHLRQSKHFYCCAGEVGCLGPSSGQRSLGMLCPVYHHPVIFTCGGPSDLRQEVAQACSMVEHELGTDGECLTNYLPVTRNTLNLTWNYDPLELDVQRRALRTQSRVARDVDDGSDLHGIYCRGAKVKGSGANPKWPGMKFEASVGDRAVPFLLITLTCLHPSSPLPMIVRHNETDV
ncbi:hypothetical protein DFP72DRAFT_1147843 [Ephemerocybe angulata]|uniref:Uncharacterized protein n=1 Tax=Ephemerocybe angulata TaxID=980116 RepID=A0A8H6IAL8_9AGAR|nr:hypothetical protein DFP72DRAFT_1147843 [Tulosesus angulatus]